MDRLCQVHGGPEVDDTPGRSSLVHDKHSNVYGEHKQYEDQAADVVGCLEVLETGKSWSWMPAISLQTQNQKQAV